MLLDRLIQFIDSRLDGEKAERIKEGTTNEAPKPLAASPPPVSSQPSLDLPPLVPIHPEFFAAELEQFLGDEAERFLAEVVTPSLASFRSFDLLKVTRELVETLDSLGSCPSVVQTLKRHDADDEYKTLTKPLSLVTLAEHSYRVARKMVELFHEKNRTRDWDTIVPHFVVTGLAHDLGKIPAFRIRHVDKYTVADHPLISASLIDEVFDHCGRTMIPEIRDAILNHHRAGQDALISDLLKKADALAREEEVRIHAERACLNWEEWFIPNEFLALIEPEINVLRGKTCRIFSFKSMVYASPDLLYSKAQGYAKMKGAVDPEFVNPRNKPLALKRIVGRLRREGMVGDELPHEYYGMPYRIATGKLFFAQFLTPLQVEAFAAYPSVFEQRKVCWLKIITSVSPFRPNK
ncbi:MAG: HD domain-containing protein [Syntrophorhabdales bacterium]|jgi:hypothetical protein